MNPLEIFLTISSLTVQTVLCGFVFVRKAQRVLPLFAAYAFVLLISSAGVSFVNWYWGFTTVAAYVAFWASAYLYVAAFGLAITELCRYRFRNYPGIWALVWRLLTGLAVLLVIRAAIDAWGQPNGSEIFGSTVMRDFAFGSIVILASLLLIRNYYGLALDPLQRLIALGMCITCGVDAIGYTLFRNVLTGYLYPLFTMSQKALWPALAPYARQVDDIWSTVHLVSFMIAMGIWCYAFRKPLTVPSEGPVLLPASVYRKMSPEVNLRLAAFNSRLTELLKP